MPCVIRGGPSVSSGRHSASGDQAGLDQGPVAEPAPHRVGFPPVPGAELIVHDALDLLDQLLFSGMLRAGPGEAGDDQVAAPGHGVPQSRHDHVWVVLVVHVVHDRGQQQAYRLAEVQELPYLRVIDDLHRPPQVSGHHLGGDRIGQQSLPVHVNHRVVVHVNRVHRRVDLVRDLVHVAGRRQTRPDVQQLGQPGLADQMTDGPAQEVPVGAGESRSIRRHLQDRVDDLPVRGEIVLTAQEGVVDPGDVRRPGIDARRWVPVKGAERVLSGHVGPPFWARSRPPDLKATLA